MMGAKPDKNEQLMDVLAGRRVTLSERYVFTVNRDYIGWDKKEVVIDRGDRRTIMYHYKVLFWYNLRHPLPFRPIYVKWRNSRLAHRYWLYKARGDWRNNNKTKPRYNIKLINHYEVWVYGAFTSYDECRAEFWECVKLYFLRRLL